VKTPRRSLTSTVAVALVAVLGLSACQSDPSATRVAQDLVKTLAQTPAEEECMLDVIDEYDLDTLGSDASDGDEAEQTAANAELARFEDDLAACQN
jgi:hypothetical protein